MNHTPYKDVNEILNSLTERIASILGEDLVGVYLTGSLLYGDFNPENSDIDLLALIINPVSQEKLEALKKMHLDVERNNNKWANRIECSYVPLEMLSSILPPKAPRPYIGEGIFYPEAPYGNEWIINQYLLYNHGISLSGPNFKTLVKPIDIEDVRKACIRDLFEEWAPKIIDPEWLNNSHYQSYIVLNLCRILYTVMNHGTTTKKVSAAWVKMEFAPQWTNLIQTAEDWYYGKKMNLKEETIAFVQYVINKVNEDPIE